MGTGTKAQVETWRSWRQWRGVLLALGLVGMGISILPRGPYVMLVLLFWALIALVGARWSATAPEALRRLNRWAVGHSWQCWTVGVFWAFACFGAIEKEMDGPEWNEMPPAPELLPRPTPEEAARGSALIPYEVVRTEDSDNAARVKRIHRLLIKPGHSPEEIRSLLVQYEHALWEQLRDSPVPSKGTWIYVFDDRRRAELGGDDWTGMIMNPPTAFREWPDPVVRKSDPGLRPTHQDEALYNYFVEHLYGHGLSDAEVNRALRSRFKVSQSQLEEAIVRVWVSRHEES